LKSAPVGRFSLLLDDGFAELARLIALGPVLALSVLVSIGARVSAKPAKS
jgi:hypothetical protein